MTERDITHSLYTLGLISIGIIPFFIAYKWKTMEKSLKKVKVKSNRGQK